MNRFSTALAVREATRLGEEQARAGLPPDPTHYVQLKVEQLPEFNPADDPLDQDVQESMAYAHDVAETRVRIEQLELQRAQHPRPFLLVVGMVVLCLFDVEANVIFFRN